MLVRNKIGLSVGILGCVALVTASLLLWTAARSSYNQTRTALAYEELGSYLMLNGAVFRTFKRVRRDLLDGTGVLQFDFSEAEQEMNDYLEQIEESIRVEAVLTQHKTIQEEIQAAQDIREELGNAFAEVRSAMNLLEHGNLEEARRMLNQTLATRIDGRVANIIEGSIALERTQVSTSLAEVEFVNLLSFWVALGMVAVAFASTSFVLLTLVVRVNNGLKILAEGADRFAEDNLDHTIELAGSDEFAQLGERFNTMAGRIRTKQFDLKRAREKLEHAHKSLQHRDALRRQFFADIGHELRTPVAAIRGEAEVALRARHQRNEAHESALSRIVNIAEQLTKNVSDLFLIAREQAGVLDLRLEPVDLTSIGRNATDQMAGIFAEAGIFADIRIPKTPTLIEGDQQRLTQLITILLSNAITHAGDGSQVMLEIEQRESEVHVSIGDNGPGVPIDERDEVFERYFKGTSSNRNGTGLGLPIARSLTKAHGGKISVCDSVLGGACFCLSFPTTEEVSYP